MKFAAILLFVLVASFAYAYSESEIPFTIKEKAESLVAKNNITQKTVMEVLADLADHNLVQNTQTVKQIYTIPDPGQTALVTLSGRIPEFGRTSNVVLDITKPDGTIETLKSPLVETGNWSTTYLVDSRSQGGTYKVEVEFANQIKSETYFHLTHEKLAQTNVPPWFLTTFEWWAKGTISDSEIVYATEHLTKLGLVIISEDSKPSLQVLVDGQEMVRRGTTHNINVHVSDGTHPIQGAKVTLVIEDYGEDIIRKFNGFTNPSGYFVYSWEIPKSFDDIETLLAYVSVSGNGASQTQLFKFTVYCLPGEANCQVEGN